MNDNPILAKHFESPKNLFKDIKENFNKISASKDGKIIYTLNLDSKSIPIRFNAF